MDWGGRLHLITTTQDWPFADGTFDLVLSNQVLEHVVDKPAFFAQIARVLTPTGASLHLFPVSNVSTRASQAAPDPQTVVVRLQA